MSHIVVYYVALGLEAEALGVDPIVNMRYASTSVMSGQLRSWYTVQLLKLRISR